MPPPQRSAVKKDRRHSVSRARTCIVLLAAATVAPACVATTVQYVDEPRPPVAECVAAPLGATGEHVDVRVRWLVRSAPRDRHELDEWCRGVGAPVHAAGTAADHPVDSIAVITWNIHLGAAHIDSLVTDLRSGILTGSPVRHFVLLVQEARRNGGAVPHMLHADARGARRLGSRDAGAEADILDTARRLDLHLFYAPSMRNGRHADAAEDRGNAILATLPLTELTAIELPLLAQRRVAVAATIPLRDAAGRTSRLRVSSVHLDFGASFSRAFAQFGRGRELQAGALAGALTDDRNVVVGGDFNTWSPEVLEGALDLMRSTFPDLPGRQTQPTFHTAGVVPRRLDHLFLRAADVVADAAIRINDRYGSDHFPLLTWIRIDAGAAPTVTDPPPDGSHPPDRPGPAC